jgi:glutathionyl-hydroquinone reductase
MQAAYQHDKPFRHPICTIFVITVSRQKSGRIVRKESKSWSGLLGRDCLRGSSALSAEMAQFPKEQTKDGSFRRQEDAFREWVRRDGSTPYKPEPNRYHLYVSLACPWAHRTIILRKLKGLEDAIGMTVVDPVRDERGWAFRKGPGHSEDPVNGFKFLSEAYQTTDPAYSGRVTVPVLWDKQTKRIVSNSDDDLLRMLNSEFSNFADNNTIFIRQSCGAKSMRSTRRSMSA